MLVRYSVIRFMPFPETQEFANVGVVAYTPHNGGVFYRLANKRHARISNFFDDLDGKLLAGAIDIFDDELKRIQEFATGLSGKELVNIMNELTRQREGFMTFSETASLLTEQKLEDITFKLYERYVGRVFNTKEHREALLVRELKAHLDRITKYKFTKNTLDVGFMAFDLPLVASDDIETKAIKPLTFYHENPLKMVDHGTRWISRARMLLNSDVVAPKNFMFVIEKPNYKDKNLDFAYMKLDEEMRDLGVEVHQSTELHNIKLFARFASESPDGFALN